MMKLTDDEFREAYHPLHVPAHYEPAGTEQDQIIFCLAELGEATAEQVIGEWTKQMGRAADEQQQAFAQTVLKRLFAKGLLNGTENDGLTYYNLHKITHANDGETNPDLLAPGLD